MEQENRWYRAFYGLLQNKNLPSTLHTSHEYTCIPALVSFRDEEAKMELEGGDEFIEVKVTSPHKVGVGQWSRESRL